ncbi:MAG: SDR family NAD(P)-dependent oxidoreductase [Crocinitomicaceae bacterium]
MNKNIVIVGASRGIGLELTRICAKLPDTNVIALARNCTTLKDEFRKSPQVHVFPFDLEGDVHDQLAKIAFPETGIDYLINNAGYLIKKPFEMISGQDFSKSFSINVIGVMQTVQYLLPKFNSTFSHIVNISSMGAFQGSVKFPELSAYAASKAALCNFTELFAVEFSNSNIKMNCLCLGAVQTEMLEEAFPGYTAPVSANEMAQFIADFTLRSGKILNGKIIPLSLSTP